MFSSNPPATSVARLSLSIALHASAKSRDVVSLDNKHICLSTHCLCTRLGNSIEVHLEASRKTSQVSLVGGESGCARRRGNVARVRGTCRQFPFFSSSPLFRAFFSPFFFLPGALFIWALPYFTPPRGFSPSGARQCRSALLLERTRSVAAIYL